MTKKAKRSPPVISFVSEAEIDRRFNTSKLLKSGGDYGLHVLLIDGDLEDGPGPDLFSDEWFYGVKKDDVGTVLITGDVRSKMELGISDRLMCLVVLGSFEAAALGIWETEMYVGGDLTVGILKDTDSYLTVKGKRSVKKVIGYGNEEEDGEDEVKQSPQRLEDLEKVRGPHAR